MEAGVLAVGQPAAARKALDDLLLHLAEQVRREEDRPPIGPHLLEHRLKLLLEQRVEAAGWLVEDQRMGVAEQHQTARAAAGRIPRFSGYPR